MKINYKDIYIIILLKFLENNEQRTTNNEQRTTYIPLIRIEITFFIPEPCHPPEITSPSLSMSFCGRPENENMHLISFHYNEFVVRNNKNVVPIRIRQQPNILPLAEVMRR